MWPFPPNPQPIWGQESKTFIRQDKMMPNDTRDSMEIVNVYAVEYIDLVSGKRKIEEQRELV